MRTRAFWLLAGLVTALHVDVGRGGQDLPTFRTGVRSVEVDVLVTDRDGNAVRDLTPEDFTLLEDGRPQKITSFSFVDIPIEPANVRKESADSVEPDIVRNQHVGRTYVILLDAFGRLGPRSRLIARQFVEEAVGADDYVAVIDVLGNMSSAQGFTNSRAHMLAAIDRVYGLAGESANENAGGDADSDQSDVNVSRGGFAGDPVLLSFRVIEDVSKRLGLINGRRKAIIWFDPPSVFQAANIRTASRQFAQRDVIRAAARNNVSFYVVSTRGLTLGLGADSLAQKVGLRVLAEDTGGDIIVDSNNFSRAFERFVRDNSSYYLLGYEPSVEHRDGAFHRLSVRVNRRNVTVRARPGYFAPEPDAKPEEVPVSGPVAAGMSMETAQALRMPLSTGNLALELFAAPFKGQGRDGSVVLGVNLRGEDLGAQKGARLEFAHQAMTPEGTITPGAFHALSIHVPRAAPVAADPGVRVVDRLDLPRGRHQVRVVVHQTNGKTGSVVADVEIPDFTRRPVMLSGVLLSSDTSALYPTLLGDERAAAALGSHPTARRRFDSRDTVTAYVEVYVNGDARVEDLRVAGTLTRGQVSVRSVPATRVMAEPDRTGYTVRLPLTELPPRNYLLEIDARAGGHSARQQIPIQVE